MTSAGGRGGGFCEGGIYPPLYETLNVKDYVSVGGITR